eukprot:m.291488 g.291488  ORF g.291488 m.291488 type:complete len:135 (-) comp19476_c1_seq4:164-568(-)
MAKGVAFHKVSFSTVRSYIQRNDLELEEIRSANKQRGKRVRAAAEDKLLLQRKGEVEEYRTVGFAPELRDKDVFKALRDWNGEISHQQNVTTVKFRALPGRLPGNALAFLKLADVQQDMDEPETPDDAPAAMET